MADIETVSNGNKGAEESASADSEQVSGSSPNREGQVTTERASAEESIHTGRGVASEKADATVSRVIDELEKGNEPGLKHSTATVREPASSANRAVGSTQGTRNNIDLLMDVNVTVRVELGRTKKTVGDILRLSPGVLVELDRNADENVDLYLNEKLFATGEVTVVDGNFAIKITRLVNDVKRIGSVM